MIKHGVGTLGDAYTITTNPDGKKVAVFDPPTTKPPKEVTIGGSSIKVEDADDDSK